jgi:hypothetical protein
LSRNIPALGSSAPAACLNRNDFHAQASSLDPTSIVYLNNMAAAHFGMNKFDECVAQCKKAIEIGRSNRADFKASAPSTCEALELLVLQILLA